MALSIGATEKKKLFLARRLGENGRLEYRNVLYERPFCLSVRIVELEKVKARSNL